MTAADLLTVGHFEAWAQALLSRVQAPAPPAAVVLYSVQKLAAVLDVHPDTVRAWLRKGKAGRAGGTVRLQAYAFTNEPRIPWPALLAYHRGEDFDLNSLPAPALLPELAAAPIPAVSPPTADPLMRVA